MVKSSSNQQLDSRGAFHKKSQKCKLKLIIGPKTLRRGVTSWHTELWLWFSFFQTYYKPKESLKQSSSNRTAGWCEASWNMVVTHRNIPRWLLLWVRGRVWDDLPMNTPIKWQGAFSSFMVLHEITSLFLRFRCFKIKLVHEQRKATYSFQA